jgi:hypothetical protein
LYGQLAGSHAHSTIKDAICSNCNVADAAVCSREEVNPTGLGDGRAS